MSSFIAQHASGEHPHIPSPLPVIKEITSVGHTTLWIAFGLLAFSTLCFFIGALQTPKRARAFHHITFAITGTAAIAYAAMAFGIGRTVLQVPGSDVYREVFYARYIDWMITTPLLLLDLALIAQLPSVEIGLLIVADVGMIVTGLIATLTSSQQAHWFFYVVSCLFFAYVIYGLVIAGRKTAYAVADNVGVAYTSISLFTVLLWTAYPFVWAFAEGLDMISPDTEIILYAVLDVSAKAVFGFWLLAMHASIKDLSAPYPASWVQSPGAEYSAIPSSEE